MNFRCEVGVGTDGVTSRHCPHHGHDLAGQGNLAEAQTASQGAHGFLVFRPPGKTRQKLRPVRPPPPASKTKPNISEAGLLTCTSAGGGQPGWLSPGTERLSGRVPLGPNPAPSTPPENPRCCLRVGRTNEAFKLSKNSSFP